VTRAMVAVGTSIACCLTCTGTVRAEAQPYPISRTFISLNAGAQPQRRTITTSSTFSIYEEPATVTSKQPIRNGAVFDVSGGYRIWRRVALAVGFSTFGRSSASTVAASIPDPVFFGRPKAVMSGAPDLEHVERGIHLQAVWFIPVTGKIDVALSAGPSFIHVTQQLTPTVSIPANTQDVELSPITQTGTAVGANAGFEGSYMFTPRFGAGIFVRYAGGVVDLPAASGVAVGGFRTGVGLRVRF